MTWLINGGTTTGFCLVDGGEVRYTKTLTTPYDLSRCLFDGLAKVSDLAYGGPRLAAPLQSTDCIRYSTAQGTNALVQRAGPQLGLLVNDLSARGARRLVIAASGSDVEARAKGCTLVICSARSRCCSSGNWSPTSYDIRAPGRACSAHSCTRPLCASCSTPTGGCGTPGPPAAADLPAEADRVFAPSRPSLPPEAVMKQVRSMARPVPAWPFRTPGMRSSL